MPVWTCLRVRFGGFGFMAGQVPSVVCVYRAESLPALRICEWAYLCGLPSIVRVRLRRELMAVTRTHCSGCT
jgi:hypothetical protein